MISNILFMGGVECGHLTDFFCLKHATGNEFAVEALLF